MKFQFSQVGMLNQALVDRLPEWPATVFFHAEQNLLERAAAGKLDFINLLANMVSDWGYLVQLEPAGPLIDEAAAADPRHLHIVMGDEPRSGPNIISSVPGYLNGFWYFDEKGTRNNSSINDLEFSPKGMDVAFAKQVFAKLQKKFVTGNVSKYEQVQHSGFYPIQDSISIFLQDFGTPKYYENYVSYPDLIAEVIANRSYRHVYIKPHPMQKAEEMEVIMSFHDPDAEVTVTNSGIHQLLATSDLAVTQTSAVGFEAFLHKVPVVLAGQTDFHHNAVTAHSRAEVGGAMEQAMRQHWPFEKYLVWFLKHNLMEPVQRKRTVSRCQAILNDKGFGLLET